jgi:hypothetical protein
MTSGEISAVSFRARRIGHIDYREALAHSGKRERVGKLFASSPTGGDHGRQTIK